ncbi:MAG: COX15/CtaA family protein [Opitutia bacterium]
MTASARARPDRLLLGLCWATLLWAVLVLQAGGFTTSIQAGMAFLDWPLSNGSVNPPGWLTEIDKFAEHSHRLAATGLGLLIVVLAVAHARREPRRLVRLAAYALLALVLLQGGLGGLRVLLDKLNVGGEGNVQAVAFAVAHAVNAQLTIALLAAIALGHTRGWADTATSADNKIRRLGRWAVGLTLAVILAGALMRQNRFTTWVSGGSPLDWFVPAQGAGALWWFNFLHRSGALLAALAVGAFALALLRGGRRFGGGIVALLAIQLTLGILAIQLPLNPHVRTVHLVSGAALFSLVVAGALLAHRREGALGEV